MKAIRCFSLLALAIVITSGCHTDPNAYSRYDRESHFYCHHCRHYHPYFHDHYYSYLPQERPRRYAPAPRERAEPLPVPVPPRGPNRLPRPPFAP